MNCPNCATLMLEANFRNSPYSCTPFVSVRARGWWESERRCDVLCHVCPKCGHIAFQAKNPSHLVLDE